MLEPLPPVQFVGIDLAWGSKNTTAAVALEYHDGALKCMADADALLTDDQIVQFLSAADAGHGLIVGIDAPLVVPNLTGERPVEAILRRCFARYAAGAHPANRTLFANDPRGERIARRLLTDLGVENRFDLRPRDPAVRCAIEVFPHPAHVALFGLSRTLKYKARVGRNYESRRVEYDKLVGLLHSLQSHTPALTPPQWLASPGSLRASGLKRYEDRLDALTCAYVAAYFWYWGNGERCRVIGSLDTGYIVTPISPQMRECLDFAP